MARIWDKLLLVSANTTLKLHQKCDRIENEKKYIVEYYAKKKEEKLKRYALKANNTLGKIAYEICDKNEYADSVMGEKLQRYDVKKYLSHRRVNHEAAVAIFKAVKAGEKFDGVLLTLKEKNEQILAKRADYVAKLQAKRDAFVKSCEKPLDESAKKASYDNLVKNLKDGYYDLERQIDESHASIVDKKIKRLDEKEKSLKTLIGNIEAKAKKDIKIPSDTILSVKGLKMYFGGLKAVDDLTFDVKRGEIFGLIGPNGAGKTTVFNCITRFYDATDGEMYFENKYGEVVDLRNYKVHDVILHGISCTFQNIELVKEISVIENLLVAATRSYSTGVVAHALAFPKLKKEEEQLKEKAMKILKFMGLESYAGWLAFGLPYGILKKVEIARALMADAKLIIMDEPAAGLNDSETAELTKTIRKIRDEFGVTILLVEHDMGLVMNVCDTVCAISFGQMLAIGTTEEIQKNKAVQEAYLGVEEDE